MTSDSGPKNEGSACGRGGGSCGSRRTKWIWIGLVVAVVGVLIAKNTAKKPPVSSGLEGVERPETAKTTGLPSGAPETTKQGQTLPRLVDLGAHSCIPCRMMAPILTQLQKEYSSMFKTEFIDVWKDPEAGRRYGIRVIPTQIFFDAEGRELYRHEGFFSKKDILATWERFGVKAAKTNGSAGGVAPP